MNHYKIIHKETGAVLASQVKLADNFWTRFSGLMLTTKMEGYDGILFEPGNSIQTCFMLYPIDVVFISANNTVVKIIRSMKPWRMTRMYLASRKVLEVAAGTVPTSISEGSELEVVRV
jgi:hypothetical protein